MKRISFNLRFVNKAGNDLIPGKIHTIRQNYDFWKRFEGKEVALFTWEGKPYHSNQKVFCIKRIISVQSVIYHACSFWEDRNIEALFYMIPTKKIATNDGFTDMNKFEDWFRDGKYKPGKMAVLHFTDFKY